MAGRKGFEHEMLANEVIKLSLGVVRKALKDPDYPLEKKCEIAKHFGVKAIPQKIEGMGFGNTLIIYQFNGKRNNDPKHILPARSTTENPSLPGTV